MIQLLDNADLSPIARVALTSYLSDVPEGGRVSRKSYDIWRAQADDPLLPSYHSLESTQPGVGTLFDRLSDESSRTSKQSRVTSLCEAVKRFYEMTGSKRIRDYNHWRKIRLEEYGETHPAPSLDTRGVRWADVLEQAGLGGVDRSREPEVERCENSLASFLEQSAIYSSTAYKAWRKNVIESRSPLSEAPSSTTALLNAFGPSWTDVLAHMGIDPATRKRVKSKEVRIEFSLEDGQLVASPFGGYLYTEISAK
ncbi:hypothetical protein C0431_12550 [bacterium]|nr:hypothetical protein [bacterium]